MYSTTFVESNGKLYLARWFDHNTSHQIDEVVKKYEHCGVKKGTKINLLNSFDEKAKKIDKYAILLMPIVFTLISIVYWTTYLRQG